MNAIYVLDRNFNLLGVIDEYISTIWRPSYSDIGDFEIFIGATDKAIDLLTRENYVVRSSDILVDNSGNVTYKNVMVIKNLVLTTDVENGDLLTVTGKELKTILHQRIVWKQTKLTGTAEDGIRRLVTENAITPENTNRIIPKLELGDKYYSSGNLPDGYTELEYIESNGTQYIDTGYKPNQDTRMDIVGQYVSGESATTCIAGCRNGSSQNFWVFWGGSGMANFYARYNTGSVNLQVAGTFGDKHTFSLNKNVFSVDGVESAGTYAGFTSPHTIYLFAQNHNGTKVNYPASVRIFSCQLYSNGTLARDFVPCKNADGVLGLFDVVNSKFYPNNGTGEFIGGNPVNGLADKIEKQVTGDYLDEAIIDICTAYGYGWEIYGYNDTLKLRVYNGVDRSYQQNSRPYVVFSEDFENLYNTEYQLNTENYANTALVGGEGEGLDRIYITINDDLTGLNRYETFVDAKDISRNKDSEDAISDTEYDNLLLNKGGEDLATKSYTEGFTGEVLSDVAFKYQRDYDIGDIVTVINKYGMLRNARVLSAIESEDDSGTKLLPQFNL